MHTLMITGARIAQSIKFIKKFRDTGQGTYLSQQAALQLLHIIGLCRGNFVISRVHKIILRFRLRVQFLDLDLLVLLLA